MADKPLVLIVDDEKDLADNLAELIRSSGLYGVFVANSADQADQVLKKNQTIMGLGSNRIRLVILDIKMPQVDGLQFLRKIRLEYPGIGVVILTAYEDKDKWEKAREGLVAAYIKKPVKEEELLAVLKRFFAGKENWMVEQTKWELITKEEEEGEHG